MLPSISRPKFLLDENVREELFKFFRGRGVEIRRSPKGATNGIVASLSKKNGWVLVTNDSDFAYYSLKRLFAVILLRIGQDDIEGLIASFNLLLSEFKQNFEGKLIILKKGSWQVFPLGSKR